MAKGRFFNCSKDHSPATQASLLTNLFHFTAFSNLTETEALLKSYPNLVYLRGTLKDSSARTFENITAFQYAWWAQDKDICNIFLKFLPREDARQQLSLFDDLPHPEYGSHYSFKCLLKLLQDYIHHTDAWDWNSAQYLAQLQKVQDSQNLSPSWLINLYSHQQFYHLSYSKWCTYFERTFGMSGPKTSRGPVGDYSSFNPVTHPDILQWNSLQTPIFPIEAFARRVAQDLEALSALEKTRTDEMTLIKDQLKQPVPPISCSCLIL